MLRSLLAIVGLVSFAVPLTAQPPAPVTGKNGMVVCVSPPAETTRSAFGNSSAWMR